MNSMTKIILHLYVCWAHTFSLCGSKDASSSCRRSWSVLCRKSEGEAGGQKDQDQCGCGHGYQKNDDSNWGHYSTFITRELRTEDINAFQNYLRMLPELFDEILEKITLAMEKHDTKVRSALPPGLKPSVTLRHLATIRHCRMHSGAVRHPSVIWCQTFVRPSLTPTRMKYSPFL